LCEHGCDELQGFLLGRPMPPERLPHRAREAAVAPAAAARVALAGTAD